MPFIAEAMQHVNENDELNNVPTVTIRYLLHFFSKVSLENDNTIAIR